MQRTLAELDRRDTARATVAVLSGYRGGTARRFDENVYNGVITVSVLGALACRLVVARVLLLAGKNFGLWGSMRVCLSVIRFGCCWVLSDASE